MVVMRRNEERRVNAGYTRNCIMSVGCRPDLLYIEKPGPPELHLQKLAKVTTPRTKKELGR